MPVKSETDMRWKAAALNSPISPLSSMSPSTGGFHAKLRNRVPTQLRRTIPLYLTCLTLLFLVLNADIFSISPSEPVFKRHAFQKSFAGSVSSSSPTHFPKKIWQSWKVDPFNFATRDSSTARSWTTKNPGFRYEVLTDTNSLEYVEQHFGTDGLNRPDIVEFYNAINLTIIKADLLRYLIMYAEGGVYADIDVEALKPVERFVPARYNPADIDMVIGIEIDQPEFRDHPILGQKSTSFCQWTFMCKPHLPVMLQLVENIMDWLSGVAANQGVPTSDVVLDFDEVISGTGPSAFTAAVLKEMNRHVQGSKKISWDRFHAMDESRLVSRVLVLDVEAFAAGQGHSDSGNHNSRSALVKHHYHASNWPSKHPRFSHPAYGEVERCNWDAACVKKWGEDVEAYKKLSPQEQHVKIEERKAEVARQLEAAKKMQEEAIKLEQFGQAMKKAEQDALRRVADQAKEAKDAAQGPALFGFSKGSSPQDPVTPRQPVAEADEAPFQPPSAIAPQGAGTVPQPSVAKRPEQARDQKPEPFEGL